MMAAMPAPINLLDRLPLPNPLEINRMADHVAPFLSSHADSFERLALRANYAVKRPPLSLAELRALRENWQK
jgi:hypothetical protein